jgi:L-methionine (R)-S-oxide reductase
MTTPTFDRLAPDLVQQIASAPSADASMRLTVERLAAAVPHYTWVGIYLLDGDELVLGPFVGAPSPHARIPLGRGICGAAATERRTIVVDDVRTDPRYLACSLETRSEIVVPIIADERVLGEIDIDSDRHAAFGEADRRLLAPIAAALAARLARPPEDAPARVADGPAPSTPAVRRS